MATLNANLLSLLDWAKRVDPKGKTPYIAELLSQNNGILDDMRFLEGNLPTGHRTTVRTGLPAVAWRLLNGSVASSKSTTAQLDEQCGMLEAYSEVDVDLAKLNGNEQAFRLSEAAAFIEAMKQEWAATTFYGNSGTAPEEFTGLAPRYAAISGANNGENVLNGGGTGSDNSSIWLVVHGDMTFHGIFPKGSMAGLQHTDYGEQVVQDSTGIGTGRMRAYRDHFQWKGGIALRDWRYVVRICNIDISNLVAKSSAADLVELMIKAIHRLYGDDPFAMGRPAFYMNRSCYQMLDIQRRDDVAGGGQLSYEVVDGKRIAAFRGIPIRKVDALLETEATIS
jgi:hypothetical protein